MMECGASALRELVAPWASGQGYVVRLETRSGRKLGNNGDTLMHAVFHELLRDFGMNQVSHQERRSADYLVVPPNGALLDSYQAPTLLARQLTELPDVPIVIFPSSAKFDRTDPATMFAGRESPVLWILREGKSYAHLAERWGESLADAGVTLALDHDVVISGRVHSVRIMKAAASARRHGSALVVSRLGVEATDMRASHGEDAARSRLMGLGIGAYRRLPAQVSIPIRRIRTRNRQRLANSALLEMIPPEMRAELSAAAGRPASIDISDPTLSTFRDFASAIVSSEIVATNRLHVAIPALLMEKRVVLVDSGYHKLQGVFEQSLQGMDNLTFVGRHG